MTRTLTAASAALALAATATLASAQQIIYQSSFEGTDGGWTGTGDWERGEPSAYDPSAAGATASANGGVFEAADGDELWATVLDGPHNNAPSGTRLVSTLSQSFDFTNLVGPVTLTFDHYLNSGSNSFDMASVEVNGTELVLYSGTEGTYDNGGTPGVGTDDAIVYAQGMVDLSAFAGQSSVDVAFVFDASTVVNRDGWYVDNVAITANIPEPATAGVLAFAGLGLLRRRRA